jgi:glycosyltransferase 2 family protein
MNSPAISRSRSPAFAALQLALSVVMLVAILALADSEQILTRLKSLEPRWALATVILVSLQLAMMAERWRSIAKNLGVPLGYRYALREYYVSMLLNQVMPFGVLGDALRAVRHTRRVRRSDGSGISGGRVVLAIVLERASGQLTLDLIASALLFGWWPALAPILSKARGGQAALVFAALFGTGITLAVALRARPFARARQVLARGARVLFSARGAPVVATLPGLFALRAA